MRCLSIFNGTLLALLLGPALAGQSLTVQDLFDGTRLDEIRLSMDPADWQNLHDKYLENTYYPCDLEWRGMTVPRAGIRSRGTGSRNPIKPGLGIDFSRYNSAQRFLGLKSIVLRNFTGDISTLHERITMQMFERMGLPYERTVHVRVYVNGSYAGLFLLVEPIDDRFLTTRFGESEGYLYEFVQLGDGYHLEYLGDDPALYSPNRFEPKNHSSDPQAQWFVEMIRAINLASDDEFVQRANKYIDVEAFVAHVAMEQFLAETDGVLNPFGMTNFYFYRRLADNRSFFLVWDKELTFSNAERPIFWDVEPNVLMRRALAVPALRQRYLDTLHQAAEAGESWMAAEVDRQYQLIRLAVTEDPSRVCVVNGKLDPCPLPWFEQAINYTRDFAIARPKFVQRELEAAGWSPGTAPHVSAGLACNAASGTAVMTPGGLTRMQVAVSADPNETTVKVCGIPAPVVKLSGNEIWFQTPFSVPCGPASVTVTSKGNTTAAVGVEVRPWNPGVFAVTHATGIVVDRAAPATGGETIVIWATGLGVAKSFDHTGVPAPANGLFELKDTVSAVLDGQPLAVRWAGLAPGFIGLQVVIAEMPPVPGGKVNLPLTLSVYSEPGASYELAVR